MGEGKVKKETRSRVVRLRPSSIKFLQKFNPDLDTAIAILKNTLEKK